MLRFNTIDDYGNKRNIEDRKENQERVPVPVRGDNGKWGYKLGTMNGDRWVVKPGQEWEIEPKYDTAWPFDLDPPFAQVKVDEEKFYIDSDGNEIPCEELDKYPVNHDGVTFCGLNFIKTTKGAETYLNLNSCKIPRPKEYFYQIFKDAWFDYNDVSEILAKAKSRFTHDHIPNWGMTRYKTMNGIIAETEVWLITDRDAKRRLSIEVRNRFTGKEEWLTIPEDLGSSPVNRKIQDPRGLIERIKKLLQTRDSLKREQMDEQIKAKKLQEIEEGLSKLYKELWGEDERTHTDWMGCYIPLTGTILIKIDSVDEAADLFGCPRDLLFQKVLLHEFIHAALDLWPRDAAGNISYHKEEWKWEDADGEFFNEESIDNTIVLKLYKGTPGYRDVKGFIELQPYYYRRAVELYESKLLPQLLEELIAYKISAPVSTTSTVSP